MQIHGRNRWSPQWAFWLENSGCDKAKPVGNLNVVKEDKVKWTHNLTVYREGAELEMVASYTSDRQHVK